MAMTRREWVASALGAMAFPHLDWRLRVRPGDPLRALDAQQSELVATIADLIIPTTDTPGARAAGVHQFIDLTLAEWLDAADRDRFLAGLADVDARAQSAYGAPFIQCSAPQQTALLRALDNDFFQMMKRLTLVGYYTSEIGANQELHYQIIPGRYDPCYPLEAAQRGEP